jgi:hypothetical protein
MLISKDCHPQTKGKNYRAPKLHTTQHTISLQLPVYLISKPESSIQVVSFLKRTSPTSPALGGFCPVINLSPLPLSTTFPVNGAAAFL